PEPHAERDAPALEESPVVFLDAGEDPGAPRVCHCDRGGAHATRRIRESNSENEEEDERRGNRPCAAAREQRTGSSQNAQTFHGSPDNRDIAVSVPKKNI